MAGSYRKLAVVGKMNNLYLPALGVMIVLCMAGLLWMSKAMAEPVPAYRGCTLAWDYSIEDQAKIGGFGVFRGDTRVSSVAPNVRTFPCDDLGLAIGETATIKLRAWGISGGVSPWASIELTYRELPIIPAPSRIRTIWEWEVAP
jgi:hypothetical protein